MLLKIEPGASADVLSRQELAEELVRSEIRAAARSAGYKWVEQALPVNPGAGAVQLGGPGQGWHWKMRLVAVQLAAAGAFGAFKGEGANTVVSRPIMPVTNSAVLAGLNVAVFFFPDDIIVQGGQQVFLQASQFITSYYYGAVQVPAERLGEHLS